MGINFRVQTEYGDMSFAMPVNVEAACKVLLEQRRSAGRTPTGAQRKQIEEQSARTAWKVAQEWVEIQLTLVAMNQAEMAQIFMPYTVQNGKTMFQSWKENVLALPAPEPESEE